MSRALLLLVAALAGACAKPATPPIEPHAAPLAVATSRVQSITRPAEFDAGGIVRAKNIAAVASRILAPVLDVRVRAGARVRAGDTLVTLDARDLQAQAARSAAALTAARESVRAAEAEERAAQAALRLASASFDRVDILYRKGAAAGSEADAAVAGLETARARATGVTARAAEAAAALNAAEEASKAAAITASYAVITSPFTGVVTERLIDPGAMAAPGAALLRIEETSLYRLEVPLDESRARAVAAGQTARANVGDGAGTWVDGRISEIASIDAASHSFVVKIDLPAAPAMASGLFGRARFRGNSERALVASAAAVVRRGQLTFVFAVDDRSVAHLRPVRVGRVADGRVDILAGLDAGETVVDDPPPALTDGAQVSAGAAP